MPLLCPTCKSPAILGDGSIIQAFCPQSESHHLIPPFEYWTDEMKKCRRCKLPVTKEAVTVGYWKPARFAIHEDCRKAEESESAIAQQSIDADCNDCKHFKRGKFFKAGERMEDGRLALTDCWTGTCLKFNKPTLAYPKMFSGHECFEHRKAQ